MLVKPFKEIHEALRNRVREPGVNIMYFHLSILIHLKQQPTVEFAKTPNRKENIKQKEI